MIKKQLSDTNSSNPSLTGGYRGISLPVRWEKVRLRSYKKLRHALLSRPTAPGPHIPPARADKYVFQTELFSWHALLSPLSSPPCWLRPGRVCYWSLHQPATGQQRNWIQLKIEICFNWTSRFATNFFRDWGPFIENQLLALWAEAKFYFLLSSKVELNHIL